MAQYTADQWRTYRARRRSHYRAYEAERRSKRKRDVGDIPGVRVWRGTLYLTGAIA